MKQVAKKRIQPTRPLRRDAKPVSTYGERRIVREQPRQATQKPIQKPVQKSIQKPIARPQPKPEQITPELPKNELKKPRTKLNTIFTFVLIFIFTVLTAMSIALVISGKISETETADDNTSFSYDDSITQLEYYWISNALSDAIVNNKLPDNLPKNIKFKAETVLNSEDLKENQVLFDTFVPVTGFYNSKLNISQDELKNLKDPLADAKKYSDKTSEEEADKMMNCVAPDFNNEDVIAPGETREDDGKEALELTFNCLKPQEGYYSKGNGATEIYLLSLETMSSSDRLLSVDGFYYLDGDKNTAMDRVITIESKGDISEIIKVLGNRVEPYNKDKTLSFAQTGVNAISRAMLLRTAEYGSNGSYFAEKIGDFLIKKDLTHISSEVSYHDGCTGGTNTMVLCSDWRTLESITRIGTDIVELTGNHNNNYGHEDNIRTINRYHELGMSTFGGGINETEAKKPLRIEAKKTESDAYTSRQNKKNANITMIGINESTSTVANGELASGDNPGANGYDEGLVTQQIKEAKDRGDFVIVDIQFAECYCYPAEGEEDPDCDAPINGQKDFFRSFVDRGADMVIGTQAHQPQTFEFYNGTPIYYGLGNLMFDQTYWPGTMRSLILTHYFIDGNYVQTRISPTLYDTSYQTYLMDYGMAEGFVDRLTKVSQNL